MTKAVLADDVRWRAVQARDRRLDGAFVFGVSTTGIYCRPSCPARRPRRERVRFFAGPDAAESAGFRACRRCRPRERDAQRELVERVLGAIERQPEGPARLADLAAAIGVSASHLQRTFKRVTGLSPRQLQDARRLRAFKRRLKEGRSVTEAIYDAGYGSSSRAYERTEQLGMTPLRYRQGGRATRLTYAIVGCPLGRLLVASTERGVAAVAIGDDEASLETALREEYREAELVRDDGAHAAWIKALAARAAGREDSPEIPLDIRATAFEWRVYQALRDIPRGRTRSYGEIARRLGKPSAARAVGRACATNPVALAVPCHRAVGASGALTGYRWGVERKRRLLELEAGRRAR